eukprot:1121014-Amphidinium_carterae.1
MNVATCRQNICSTTSLVAECLQTNSFDMKHVLNLAIFCGVPVEGSLFLSSPGYRLIYGVFRRLYTFLHTYAANGLLGVPKKPVAQVDRRSAEEDWDKVQCLKQPNQGHSYELR